MMLAYMHRFRRNSRMSNGTRRLCHFNCSIYTNRRFQDVNEITGKRERNQQPESINQSVFAFGWKRHYLSGRTIDTFKSTAGCQNPHNTTIKRSFRKIVVYFYALRMYILLISCCKYNKTKILTNKRKDNISISYSKIYKMYKSTAGTMRTIYGQFTRKVVKLLKSFLLDYLPSVQNVPVHSSTTIKKQ